MKHHVSCLSFVAICTTLLISSSTYGAPNAELWDFWDHANQAEPVETSDISVDHSVWQTFLNEYLITNDPGGINLVRYKAIAAKGSQGLNRLNQYISSLEAIDPRTLSKDEQFSYWVNLYNAATIRLIANAYPVASIRKTGKGFFSFGPWDDVVVEIAGKGVTLNDIEHRILRPIWKDSRIHFVVNCASNGCPNLHQTALTADNHQTILSEARIAFINHPRAVSNDNGDLRLSSIFDWYAEDFGDSQEAVLDYIETYLNQSRASVIQNIIRQPKTTVKYDYDWSLNLGK